MFAKTNALEVESKTRLRRKFDFPNEGERFAPASATPSRREARNRDCFSVSRLGRPWLRPYRDLGTELTGDN